MKNWAFVIMAVGFFTLALVMEFSQSVISSGSEIENLPDNSKVLIRGKVVSEKYTSDAVKTFVLDNALKVDCRCGEEYLNKSVEIEGVVDEYNGRKEILVLRIFSQS